MPKPIEDAKQVEKWIQEKQKNEVDLANALLKIFDTTPDLIQPLRLMARHALEEILTLNDVAKDTSILLYKSIVNALKDEKKANMDLLKAYKVPTSKVSVELPAQLEGVMAGWETFTASQCSDVVRLYGTVAEKAVAVGKGELQFFEMSKDALAAWKAKIGGKDFETAVAAINKNPKSGPAIEAQKKFEEFKKGFRKGAKDGTVQETWDTKFAEAHGRHRLNKAIPAQAKLYEEQIAKTGMGEVQTLLVGKKGGQSLFVLADSSTIGKMDRVFGLVPAADISGTTADTIAFINHMFATSRPNARPDLLPAPVRHDRRQRAPLAPRGRAPAVAERGGPDRLPHWLLRDAHAQEAEQERRSGRDQEGARDGGEGRAQPHDAGRLRRHEEARRRHGRAELRGRRQEVLRVRQRHQGSRLVPEVVQAEDGRLGDEGRDLQGRAGSQARLIRDALGAP